MEGEEEGGLRLSKRIAKGEVDYSTKSGTAWSHSYLNQKPWHPLSYPNQKRKWIAEQSDAQKQRRSEEVAREFAQEQEFFRQAAAISKKEKEKVEMMQAVSFMYMRPPGYNAESAKAAEIADETKKMGTSNGQQDSAPSASGVGGNEGAIAKDGLTTQKRRSQPKDIFGRPLPTEEEFEVLKNAPRLETGVAARVKPFGVEIRNVRCVRCGTYGHQSGDRECPLKDAIMPNEQSRLKRDDPLTTIMAHTASDEPLKWELKQHPGCMSPPRGGYKLDDPNQQIIPEDDIFDEYGGFLNGAGDIPELLTSFSRKKTKKSKSRKKKCKHKHKRSRGTASETSSDDDQKNSSHSKVKHSDRERKRPRKKHRTKKRHYSTSSTSSSSESDRRHKKRKRMRHKQHNSVSSVSSSDSD